MTWFKENGSKESIDASRFDYLARRLADHMSRRHLTRVLSRVAVGGAVSSSLGAQPALAARQSTAVCAGESFNGFSAFGIALTFTPEVSGKLSEARVKISHSFDPEVGYLVRILGTDATGKPTLSRVLAKKTIPFEAVLGGVHDLIATFKKRKAAKVEVGKTYAILVTRTQAAVGVTAIVHSEDPCTDGNLFILFNEAAKSFTEQSDSDVVFEAFVGY